MLQNLDIFENVQYLDMVAKSPEACCKKKWSALVRRHHQFLLDHIDPDFGLLEKLVSKRIFSYKQREIVKTGSNADERNGKMLEIIRSGDKLDEMIDALKCSNQTHVVNYLEADGKYSTGVDWPLSEREENLISDNLEQLIELIEVTELIVKLHAKDVINKSQRDFIRSRQTSYEQNDAFLNILRRRSIRDYNLTILYLKETNQPHVAQLLEEGGAIVRLHVNTDGDPEAEEEIAEEIKDFLGNRSVEECGRILQLTHCKIIAARTGQSIVLYIYLQTMKQLHQLKESIQSGSIKEGIQLFFNKFSSPLKQVAVLSVKEIEGELSRVQDHLKADDSYVRKTKKRPYGTDEENEENNASSTLSKSTPMRSPQTKRRRTESPSLDTSSQSAAVCDKIDDLIKVEALVRHKDFLEEIVDSDSGLLDKLHSKETLTYREITLIEGRHTYKTRNARLLKCITDQDKCNSFVDSLRDTRQRHVVNYLIGDGSFEDRFDADWPLTYAQIDNINDSEESMVNSIDMNSLLKILHEEDVINEPQRRLIDSKRNSVERNKAFFEFFRRMSQKYYRETMRCLCKADQARIAQIVDESGVVLRILVKTDGTPEEEDHIVNAIMDMIKDKGRLWKLTPLKVIAAKMGHGVAVYVHCRVLKDLKYAQESLESNELKNRVQNLFTSLSNRPEGLKVLDITAENEDEVMRFFELKEILRNHNLAEKVESRVILQSLNDLPLEVLDYILQSCYLLLVHQSVSKNLRETFPEQLIPVNYLWLQRMTRRKFKKNISRRLAALFQRTSKRYTVVQNIRQFLMEFIRPSHELIAKLESTQYLTKEQVDIIQKLMRDRDKTFELLDLLKPFDSPKIETLIQCLRQTNQNRVAFVVESGGTVVKSTAQNFDEVKQMIKSFNDLLSQRDQSAKVVKIFDNNISRRKYRSKKMTAFWIWFRDESTFEAMRKKLEAKSNHCHGNQVHEESVIPSSVNVDLKQFRAKLVSFSIFAKFTARLVAAGEPRGVTKLKDKIYVVCRTDDPSIPCIICVFEDRNPFRLQKKLEIKEIKKPAEIASREKDNCLYVTDHAEDCIWRIKEIENENKEQENKPVKWFQFELPRRLLCSYTMTSDDELLIIEGEREKEVLNIYGSDAKISRTVDLPEEISKHFVLPVLKTSTGQLIIHHSVKESKKSLLLQQRLSRDEKFVLSQEQVEECEKVKREDEQINLRIEQEKETEEEDTEVGKGRRSLEKGKGVKDLGEQKEEEAFGDKKEGDELEKGEVEEDLGVTVEEEKEFGEGEEDKEEESEDQDESKEPDEKREETDHEESEVGEEEKEEADQDQSEESDNEGEKTDREESEVEEEEEESGEKKKSKEDGVLSVISEVNISSEMAYYVAHYIAPNTQFHPRSFAIDSDDRLFVADSPNDRVILFDSDLKWDAILIPTAEQFGKHRLLSSLFYDENNKQLFLVGLAEGENVIDVYTLNMK